MSPRLLLGAGTSTWTKSEDGGRLSVGTLDARVRFYPQAEKGFFVTGGLGLGFIRGSGGGESATETGTAAIFGIGYDFPVGRNASVTPYINAVGLRINDGNLNIAQAGVAITLH
ncbi:MAG TPA: hypothetical protein VE861_08365 [Gemmatimonadaceae bacterium]|nr:hypothetical protein [Gemmatimonadaceae bacterium]